MKVRLLLIAILAFTTALLAFKINQGTKVPKTDYQTAKIKKATWSCAPDWNEIEKIIADNDIPPIPGSGSYKWKINTSHDSAQFYFNQGINMYYAFHIIEAMASFKKATKFDPDCPMLYWAQALAYGPNINDVGYAASPAALDVIKKAKKLSAYSTTKEKLLIDAQLSRYSEDSTERREKLNQDYVDNMKAVYTRFPADADVAALYADALMLQHPWDLWGKDGTPKPWTPHIQYVLEKLLRKTPGHPGANHYYIHVMEPSPFAAKALPSADRLGKLTPGLSHTLHMPSHIYLRTGNYRKGIAVNQTAVSSYNKVLKLYEPVMNNAFLYIIHNLHMQTNNAMMAGQSSLSVLSARETANSIPEDYLQFPGALGNVVQYIHMTPVFVDIRFGRWKELLNYPEPPVSQVYSSLLFHFGRGMALANQSRFAEARHEILEMRRFMKDSSLSIPFTPFSAAIEGAVVAENILLGTIALKEKQFDQAILHFTSAVTTEDKMVYNEPRDWLLNPRHYLGNAYIEARKFSEARKTFEKDLLINNENGWALFGTWRALQGEKKTGESEKMLLRFRKAFYKSDVKLNSSVY